MSFYEGLLIAGLVVQTIGYVRLELAKLEYDVYSGLRWKLFRKGLS